MLSFLKTDLGIDIETGWKLGATKLASLKGMLEEKRATLGDTDAKKQTAAELVTYIENCEQDIAKGLELSDKISPKH